MEQIVKNILKQQGFEHISLFDKDNDIWIYTKNEEIHFCKSDLSPVERSCIGFDKELIVLTESESKAYVVNDGDSFQNFVAIDKNNRILVRSNLETCAYNEDSFILKQIRDNCFVIVSNEFWENINNYYNKHKSPDFRFMANHYNNYNWSYIFIDAKYWDAYHLEAIYGNFFFFTSHNTTYNTIIFNTEKGIIYNGENPYIWIHKDGKAHIVQWKEESGVVEIGELTPYGGGYRNIFRASDYMEGRDKTPEFYMSRLSDDILFSDKYLVFPFYYWGRYWGAFVIENEYREYDHFSARIIFFDDDIGGEIEHIALYNNLIFISRENNRRCLYNIYDGRTKIYFYYEQDRNYIVFQIPNNGFFPKELKQTQGVMDSSGDIIIPPIYKGIDIIDEKKGMFELTLLNHANDKCHEARGIYSVKKGFIVPLGSEFSFPQYRNEMFPVAINTVKDFVIYIQGGKKGLIFQGDKVLDAKFDDVIGFSFKEDFEKTPGWCLDEKTITKEYVPLCVLLYQNGKFGLFANTSNYQEKSYKNIDPIYENIQCVKIFKRHAYFSVKKDGKFGIISDDFYFNQTSEIKYDNVYYGGIIAINGSYDEECYFIVKEKGKVGAICTRSDRNIPAIFDGIDKIIKSGVLCGNKILSRSGEKLYSVENGYEYINTIYLDTFWRPETGEDYLFIDSQGKKVEFSKENDHILHLDGDYQFDTEKNKFIEDVDDEYDNSYDNRDDDIDWEKEAWDAMTDGQYGDMPEGFDGDYGFTGH